MELYQQRRNTRICIQIFKKRLNNHNYKQRHGFSCKGAKRQKISRHKAYFPKSRQPTLDKSILRSV